MKNIMNWGFIKIIFLSSFLAVAYTNCGDAYQPVNSSSGSSDGFPLPQPEILAVSIDQSSLTSELYNSHQVKVIFDTSNYQGDVEIRIARPELDEIDLMGGIVISSPEEVIDLPETGQLEVPIDIMVGTLSPSLLNEHFHIEIYIAGTQLIIEEVEVMLTVNPIFRFQVYGEGDANWRVNGTPLSELFDRNVGDPVFNFVSHAQGLRVILENYDTVNRRFHASGAIAHQGVAGTDPSADGITVGGSYTPAAILANEQSNALVYIHNGEAGADRRNLNFNVDL